MTNTQTPPPTTTVVNSTGAPVTNTVEPPAEGQSSNVQAVEAWKHSDFLCHNYVLNDLIDPLYTARPRLPKNYESHWNASTKQRMMVQDLQVLLHDIHAEGMILSETFQVAAIIEKLPPS
ncbi:hypothetical protein Tco_1424162 [Tanacetum coccineum]